MKTIRRTIHPEIKVLDAAAGLVEYVASDETIDCYREVVMASGWQFNRFQKNAPFVDSHNYESIDCLLGKVVNFEVTGGQLIETVKWAIDVPQNFLAAKGFAMTQAGYLKAVSVGFLPIKAVSKWDNDASGFSDALDQLDLGDDLAESIRCIYVQQEQTELSACLIGANPSAVARAFKAGIFTDADLDTLSLMQAKRETANSTDDPADVELARQRARFAFRMEFESIIAKI